MGADSEEWNYVFGAEELGSVVAGYIDGFDWVVCTSERMEMEEGMVGGFDKEV